MRRLILDVVCVLIAALLALGALTITPGNPPQAWRDAVARDTGVRTTEVPGWPPIPSQ